jgi:tetratricopeptide (TPR) repeat protein
LILLVFMLTDFSAFAQKGESSKSNFSAAKTMAEYKQIYDLAIKYGDYTSATQSVFGMIALDSSSLAWKDTLANLFLARGLYQQCLAISTEIYQKQPDNNKVLELLAISQQALGNLKEALDYYQKLYSRTKNLNHLYQVTVLQYDLKKTEECKQSIDSIISNPNATIEKIVINVRDGYQQYVPYKAAALNIKGVVAKDLADNVAAKKYFEEALKVFPEFALAKANIDGLTNSDSKNDDKNKTQAAEK